MNGRWVDTHNPDAARAFAARRGADAEAGRVARAARAARLRRVVGWVRARLRR